MNTQYQDLIRILNRDFLDNGKSVTPKDVVKIKNINNLHKVDVLGINLEGKKTDYLKAINTKIQSLISACAKPGNILVFDIKSNKGILSYTVGTVENQYSMLKQLLESYFSEENCKENNENQLSFMEMGMITGIPLNQSKKENPIMQLEPIIEGMGKHNWMIRHIATCKDTLVINRGLEIIHDEMNRASKETKGTENRGILEGKNSTTSIELINYHAQEYLDRLKQLEARFQKSQKNGLWEVSIQYFADMEETCNILGRLIFSSYINPDEKDEKIRCIPLSKEIVRNNPTNAFEIEDSYYGYEEHPLGDIPIGMGNMPLYCYKYKTLLCGEELGVLGRPPIREVPGFFINPMPEFDCAVRKLEDKKEKVFLGDICSGCSANEYNPYEINLKEVNRHIFITGNSGSGKTSTLIGLIDRLWGRYGIPTMIVESAKTEYWRLGKQCPELRLYTLGDERSSGIPFRMNPFERIGTVALQTHIESVLASFTAAFVLPPPMPYVLETAIYDIYLDLGWDITKDINSSGLNIYPTLSDLYEKIDEVTERLHYHTEVDSNVKAALKARINSLRIAGKGKMLDTEESTPIESLMKFPTVLEMDSIGDDEIKGFINGLFLTRLYEYKKSVSNEDNTLSHCLVIEEAHCLLGKVQKVAEGDNSKAKSIDFFCKMLAEIRAYGEGIMIAEQIPSKLAEDVIKNTNLKIVHRTLAKEDRELIGNAMNMTEEQIASLSTLKQGYAAVYSETDNHPKLVRIKRIRDEDAHITRETVIERIKEVKKNDAQQQNIKNEEDRI